MNLYMAYIFLDYTVAIRDVIRIWRIFIQAKNFYDVIQVYKNVSHSIPIFRVLSESHTRQKNRIKIKRKNLKQNYRKFAKTHGKHWIYLLYVPAKYNRKIIHLLYRYFYLYKNYTKNRL